MLTVEKIKKVTRAVSARGDLSTAVKGVSIDSRTIKKGHAFIAVKGLNFDGHDFIRAAIRKGASAVIVSKETACSGDIAVILVKDTTLALGRIAAWHRDQFNIPVIAVTGSAGKTTTKEMIAAVLGRKFKVLKNAGTENNHFGVPLTLLKLKASHRVAVLELGTNQPGDIRWIAQVSRPTVTVFTNIGESHLQKLKTRAGVFREKVQLIRFMAPDGLIIFNSDDAFLRGIAKKVGKQKMIRFGCGHQAGYRAGDVQVMNSRRMQFKLNSRLFSVNTPAKHNIYNALAAICCGLAFKISYNDIAIALKKFKFRGGRQEIKKIGALWVIDDTYNANPISFKSAISTLSALNIRGKKIVACADMLELGARSKALHEEIGLDMARSAVDVVLTAGRQARYIAQVLKKCGRNILVLHCRDKEEIQKQLHAICRPGDAVLVKGSRGMRMERIVAYLEKHFK